MRKVSLEQTTHPVLIFWIIAGWIGFAVLPWYGVEGFWSFEWLVDGWPLDDDYAPAAVLIGMGQKLWLAPMLLAAIARAVLQTVVMVLPALRLTLRTLLVSARALVLWVAIVVSMWSSLA